MLKLDYYLQRQDYYLQDKGVYTRIPSVLLFVHVGFFPKCNLGHTEKNILCASLLGECSIRLCCWVVLCRNCHLLCPCFFFFLLWSKKYGVNCLPTAWTYRKQIICVPSKSRLSPVQFLPICSQLVLTQTLSSVIFIKSSEQCRELSFQQLP